jgi:oxygen-independent coproporphyrinogen-3 oxidase
VPDEDTAYDMLDLITARTTQAGMARYEVSAYARPDHGCWHNLNYWRFGDYLGIGAGAHGKLSYAHRVVRQVRWRDPQMYMTKAMAGEPMASETEVMASDLPFEYMLNALRLREGFELSRFTETTGLPATVLGPGLASAEKQGWVVREGGRVVPTERGFDFLSDLQALFLPDTGA